MSGGHFDYVQFTIQNALSDMERDQSLKDLNMPKLRTAILEVGEWLHNVIHDLDWDISGDATIKDKANYEADKIAKLKSIVKGIKQETK